MVVWLEEREKRKRLEKAAGVRGLFGHGDERKRKRLGRKKKKLSLFRHFATP